MILCKELVLLEQATSYSMPRTTRKEVLMEVASTEVKYSFPAFHSCGCCSCCDPNFSAAHCSEFFKVSIFSSFEPASMEARETSSCPTSPLFCKAGTTVEGGGS